MTMDKTKLETAVEEIWKPIPEHESHLASSLGRVKNIKTGRATYGSKSPRGYMKVAVKSNGTLKNRNIARLVAYAFFGLDKELMVLHINGRSDDNRAENLRYGTAKDNYEDARGHGTNVKGINHGNAKLTPEMVAAIRKERSENKTKYKDIAVKYGVSDDTIFNICKRRLWKWM